MPGLRAGLPPLSAMRMRCGGAMSYSPSWATLPEALSRITASGLDKSEAKAQLCRALQERAVRFRVVVDKSAPDFGGQTLEPPNVSIPSESAPEDFDWSNSRPLAPWVTGDSSVQAYCFDDERWAPRRIAKLAVSAEDVNRIWGAPGELRTDAPPPAKKIGRPNARDLSIAIFDMRRQHGFPLQDKQIDEAKAIVAEWPKGGPPEPEIKTVSGHIREPWKLSKATATNCGDKL